MRILYCNKYNFGFSGTETYLFEAMDLMRAQGHEVALFSMADPRGNPTAYDRYFMPHADFRAARGVIEQARLASRAVYSVEARNRIRALIRDFRPDVAHMRNIYHHISPSILWELKAQGIPVVYHMNDFKMLCPSYNFVAANGTPCEACAGGKFWNIVRGGCYAGGRAASVVLAAEAYVHDWLGTYRECVDLILAPSRFVRQKLVANGWNKSKIEVIPHFQNLPQTAVPFPGRDAHILYFGRLSREKGVSDLLQAMVYLPQVWLVIAGDGPQKQQLQTLAEGLGLRNASFRGHVSGGTLQRLIAESQFTVFPSRAYETFGKSILESYAHGRAVVASDLGSRRELVEEGENGVLYRAGDAKQLAAAIAFLYERPELARQMGEAGHELVRQRYSQEQHFQALTSIYEGLAKQARAKRLAITTQPPLRVAFIGGRGVVGKYSGVERYYEEIGRRLADKGHEITAYCRSHFTPEIATYQGIRIVRLPTIRSKHLDTLVHTLLSTIHSCFGPYDIVHFHTLGPSLFSFVPRAFGKKTIVTVQGLDWQRKKWSPLARNCLKLGEWASARLPNQTIVVSHTLQARYFSRYQKQAAYVPNGTVFLEQRNGPDLEALGLAPGQYVLFLGRFSPEKNCDLLIQAFEHTDTSMALALAGGSAHSDSYAAALRQHASPRIKFTGWLSGEVLDQVLTNAAVFVLPSDMEGLSLALLEAMGAGICVLASDIPENREVIDDAGFTFRAGDPRDLERMLTVLLSDPQIRATAGARARVRVQQHYLWDDIANQTEAIYLNLTHSPQRKEAVSASADTEPVVLRAQGD